MQRALADLTAEELEALISKVVDQHFRVWLGQFMDALLADDEEAAAEIRPEFAAGLREAIAQARAGEVISLAAVREQLGE